MMKRDTGLDYIRIVLTMMIVTFHFCEANGLYSSRLFTMANGTWGQVATSAFILLSGYLLRWIYRAHISNKTAIISFYKKRLFTLFPSFYLAFLICFLIHTFFVGSPFYGGHPVKLLLSIFGIDSYVGLYGITTYAVVGEWFTGLIIMLYILFPAMNWLMNKSRLVGSVAIIVLYIVNGIVRLDPTIADASVITGMCLFWIGMLLSDAESVIKKYWYAGIPMLAGVAALSWFPVAVPRLFTCNMMGLLLFVAMLLLFRNEGKGHRITGYVSTLTYEIYLIHHFVLYKGATLFGEYLNDVLRYIIYYIFILVIIVVSSVIIHWISGKIKNIFVKGYK